MSENIYLKLYEEVQTLLILEPYVKGRKKSSKYIDEAMCNIKAPRDLNFWGLSRLVYLRNYVISNGKIKIPEGEFNELNRSNRYT